MIVQVLQLFHHPPKWYVKVFDVYCKRKSLQEVENTPQHLFLSFFPKNRVLQNMLVLETMQME